MSATPTIQLQQARPRRSLRELLLGRAMLALTDQGIVSLSTFFTLWLIGKTSKEEAGLYTMAVSIWVLLAEAHNALISNPHMLRVPRLSGGALRRFNGATLAHQFVLCGVLTLLTLLAANAVWAFGSQQFALILGVSAVTGIAWTLKNYARNFCFATRRNDWALWLDGAAAMLQVASVLVLWAIGQLSAVSMALCVGGANMLSALGWLWVSRNAFEVQRDHVLLTARRNWRLGGWLFASSMMWVAGMNLYPWVIGAIQGAGEAGIFGVCATLAALGNPPVTALQNYLGPAISHAHVELELNEFRRYVIRATLLFAAAMLPLAVVMAVFSEALLELLFKADYAGEGVVAAVLVFVIVAQAGSFAASRGLFCLGRAKLDTVTNVVPIAVLLTLGVWAVWSHGALGASLALLVSQTLGFVIRFVAFVHVSAKAVAAAPPSADVAAAEDDRVVVMSGGEA